MGTTIYRGYNFDSGVSIELEHSPNPWTTYHLSVDGQHLMSYDSLINATAGLIQSVAELGEDPVEVLDEVVSHFNDDKIYAGEEDGNLYLINEYEWDEE